MGEQLTTPASTSGTRTGPPGARHRRRRPGQTAVGIIAVGITAAFGLAACSTGDDDSSDEQAAFELDAAAVEEPASEPAAEPADDAAAGEFAGNSSPSAEAADFDLGIVGRDVIIEMHVVMSSDDIGRTVASISASAAQLGGGIASSSVDYGDPTVVGGSEGHAVLVVKVPPEQIDRLLSGLDASGTVRSIEQSAQDVTEQLVDLDVRIANARESVANVREFMDRATDLNQLVTLESELTNRQTELERLEAQQRNLSDRVALSTVTVEVVPSAALPVAVDDDDGESLGDAVRDGWQAFATALFTVVYLLAVLLPFLLLAAIIGVVAWLLMRRRRTSFDTGRHSGLDDDLDGPSGPDDALVSSASDGGSATRRE